MSDAPVSALILAGGAGRRMGGVIKPLLPVGDATVLDRQLAALVAAGVGAIVLSIARDAPAALRAAAAARGLVVSEDPGPGRGPLEGLAVGLATARGPLLVVAGDLPGLAPGLLRLLIARAAGVDAVVPRPGGRVQPLCAVYGVRCLPVLAARLAAGLLRARELPDALVAAGLAVGWLDDEALRAADPDLGSFVNWNRPGDLA